MRHLIRLVVISASVGVGCVGGALAQQRPPASETFNRHMIAAYQKLNADANRRLQGYERSSYYTLSKLDFGSSKLSIVGKGSPLTMCVAGVMETFIEAVNHYYADSSETLDAPARARLISTVPDKQLNEVRPTTLQFHAFMHEFKDYVDFDKYRNASPPLRGYQRLVDFQSKGMAAAFEKFGMGAQIPFDQLKPGDVISLDRTKGPGHSVVFLGYATRKQELVEDYARNKNDIVGFKYFSSQGLREKGQGGLSERWGYFEGFCPYVASPTTVKCDDQLNSEFPVQHADKPRDCCIQRSGRWGIVTGYILHPKNWKFEVSQKKVETEYKSIMDQLHLEYKSSAASIPRAILSRDGDLASRFPEGVAEIQRRFAPQIENRVLAPIPAWQIQQVLPEPLRKAAQERIEADFAKLRQGELSAPRNVRFDGLVAD